MRFLPALVLLAAAPLCAETFLVLPFFNLTRQQNLDWIGETLAESIRDTLAGNGVLTISRDDRREAYRRLSMKPYSLLTKASVLKVSEVLDAGQVIYGQFELQDEPPKSGTAATSRGTLRITARILDMRKMRAGPEFQAVGALEDLAALQTHLVWQSLQFVTPKTAPGEEEFRKSRPLIRLDALEYYIRGLLTQAEEQKLQFFTQSAKIDPRYAPPCFELGKLYWNREEYKQSSEWLERVPSTDTHYREATFMRGVARFELNDPVGAQTAFETVLRELPLNEVQNNLGAAQLKRGMPEAMDSFRKALEGDSNEPVYLFNVGYAYWKRGDFDKAAEQMRAVLLRDPGDDEAEEILALCKQRMGPRPGDSKLEGLERLKYEFNESAFLQLRSILESGKK